MLRFDLTTDAKGWFVGPWNSEVPLAIGFVNEGIAIRYYHETMNEVYLVARGSATMTVDGRQIVVDAGDCLVVEPGEIHTSTDSSDDYLVFVVQTPFVKGGSRCPTVPRRAANPRWDGSPGRPFTEKGEAIHGCYQNATPRVPLRSSAATPEMPVAVSRVLCRVPCADEGDAGDSGGRRCVTSAGRVHSVAWPRL